VPRKDFRRPQSLTFAIRKGCRRVNAVEYCALIYENGKMRPAETVLRMWEKA
jgi:hypothetical protein